VELAEKASTANRKRLIVQALRNALMSLSTGVFAALLSSAFFCIFNSAYDQLSAKTTARPAYPSGLASGTRQAQKTA
jgi:hypothetical protein